jgi:hypothetical protein
VIPTAPLRLRDRLADLILGALHDPARRRTLGRLAADDAALAAWLGGEDREYAVLARRRVRAAADALADRPVEDAERDLGALPAAAADLFDGGLGFEVHELLESRWREETGSRREALQGLIQIAVGYQHRANGNLAGARALLADGMARIAGRTLDGVALDAFADAVRASLASGGPAPPFPRRR